MILTIRVHSLSGTRYGGSRKYRCVERKLTLRTQRTGRKLRGFVQGVTPFRWSHDDKYFARIGEPQMISVYETPSMMLVRARGV
jgi:hypothetical protein